MARRSVSLPDDLDAAARQAGIDLSALTRKALEAELDRRERMARLDAWLDELDEQYGEPSEAAVREAEAWWAGRRPVLPASD